RLLAPAGDFPVRIAETPFCAVPPNTPHVPQTSPIPMAGPYRIARYHPKQGVVLTHNPYYPGARLRRFARIEYVPGMSAHRAIAQVKHGTADFTLSTPSPEEDTRLRAHYDLAHYRVVANAQLDLFALNTHRPLFAGARMRRAVNYAIDRSKLDALGDSFVPLPEHETDHYIPPGLPGYRTAQVYPPHPALAQARQLATPRARNTLVLLVCQEYPCTQEAAIVKTDLRRIGLRVRVEAPPDAVLGARLRSGAGWDMAWLGWIPDYPDPSAMLNELL